MFCIYAVDFAINGGESPTCGILPRDSGTDGNRHSASDLPQPHRGHASRIPAAAWLSLGSVPSSTQLLIFAKSWKAGRMLGLGQVLGYLVGTIDLSNYFGTSLGATQFKQICVIAGAAMVFCVSVTCFCVEERTLLSQR